MKILALTIDGRLTYCTAKPENFGKGRCNHVAHQMPNETQDSFIKRAIPSAITIKENKETPLEIKAIIDGFNKLDIKMKNSNIDPININVVGGFASYSFTNNMTKDVDSITKISQKIKDLANEVAEETEGLETNWLNDEILIFNDFSDWNTKRMIAYLSTHPEEFNDGNLRLNMINIKFAKPEAIVCMKIAAMTNRNKEKDRSDSLQIIRHQNYSPDDIWSFIKKYSLKFEVTDIANSLYMLDLFNNTEEYQKFIEDNSN